MNPFNLNPYNLVASVVRYFSGTPVPQPTQGGGNALLLLGYLMWANTHSSSCRRRPRSKYCICNQDESSGSDTSKEALQIMDSTSEDEMKQRPTTTPTTSESYADLESDDHEVQQNSGNRLQQRRIAPTPPPQQAPRGRHSNSGDGANITDFVTIQPQNTLRRPRIAPEHVNNATLRHRRRNNKKTTPKRLQKSKLQTKKKADTESKTIKGQYEMKTLSERFRHIRYCRCCGCEMFV